jgi:hypothetical protein
VPGRVYATARAALMPSMGSCTWARRVTCTAAGGQRVGQSEPPITDVGVSASANLGCLHVAFSSRSHAQVSEVDILHGDAHVAPNESKIVRREDEAANGLRAQQTHPRPAAGIRSMIAASPTITLPLYLCKLSTTFPRLAQPSQYPTLNTRLASGLDRIVHVSFSPSFLATIATSAAEPSHPAPACPPPASGHFQARLIDGRAAFSS